ncbi:MAG TPA: gamma-glutamyl-gamma-aminobutyrate hydrolase family protein [Acidimicrobiales bacterium]
MTSPPLIAVPAYLVRSGRVEGWATSAVATPETYLTALRRAGARGAVVMPDDLGEDEADQLLDRFDGLLLIGGGDLDPETYGQAREQAVYGVIARRDGFELALARAAIARGMPTLAICRGHQVLNVALGGTLQQHVISRDVPHGVPGVAGGSIMHSVRVQDGSRLATTLGATVADISSQHHQAVEKLGDDLEAVAWADDGVIEGIELADDDRWVIGVQWHPEDTAGTDAVEQRLFDAFVSEVARRSGSRRR